MKKVPEEKVFQKVYPFTTENIGEYFKRLDLKDKDVFTVGSSLDQAFNALLLGAKNITVFDLNANTEEFYKLKRDMILSVPREKLFSEVLKQNKVSLDPDNFPKETVMHINPYLKNDYYFNVLREKLQEDRISIVYGDIFNIDDYLEKQKFDCMIFSNILQYLDFFAKNEDSYQFLSKNFQKWKEYLNKDGIMQLLYLYSFSMEDAIKPNNYLSTYNLRKVMAALKGNELMIEWFDDSFNNEKDAIVTYTKKM
ncbi:MAG: hypothetical protein HFE81_02280 [Bacilli bacterium]|nr:hypothetical protein [Bacilli bacterium]